MKNYLLNIKSLIPKTSTFYWEGINAKGLRVNGFYHDLDKAAILIELKKQMITPLKITKKIFFFAQKKSVKKQDIIDFTRELYTLLNAGIALAPTLQIIADSQENPQLRQVIATIKSSLESGLALHEALANYSNYFDNLYCHLIFLGEQSGTLPDMLKQVMSYQEKLLQLKSKIKKALIYPITVIVSAITITTIMLMYVVPQFKTMFAEFGASLPWFTQIIITLSEKLHAINSYIILILVCGTFLIKLLLKKTEYRFKFQQWLLNIPFMGNIISKNILARFARTLAITSHAGVPLTDALKISAHSCDNLIYMTAILRIYDQVIAGQAISVVMQQSSLFPSRMTHMIALAEESGTMTMMLEKLAEYYEQQIDNSVESFLKLLEPALIIFIGVVVSALVIAMYLPIFRIGTVI